MGLKNLKSLYDLIPGNDPVENMDNQGGPPFQLSTTDASQAHIDSLQQVPGPPSNSPHQDLNGNPDSDFNTLNGTTNSPFQSATGDHMVDLLTQNAVSTNTGQTYDPSITQDLDGAQGPQSQLPTDAASQKHIDSLQQVPGGDSNSPFQDLDGEQGPQFQREIDIASQVHETSLGLVPGGDSNSPFQDLDGEPGPQSQLPTDVASQKHIDSLQQVPGFDSNSPFQDLNGVPGPDFGDEAGAGKQLNGVDLHEALLTQNYQYSHNTATTTVNGGIYDLDGGLPSSGEYLNNLPG